MTIDLELKRAFKTGDVRVGIKDSEKTILFGKSKGIIMSKDALASDMLRLKYFCELAKIPFVLVEHVPIEFGKVIGLAYPVNAVSVISEGKSKILSELA